MRALLSLGPSTLFWAFLLCLVKGESEQAHAAERVLAWMLYRIEGLAKANSGQTLPQYNVARDCRGTEPGGRCSFNEFITYTAGRGASGVPAALDSVPENQRLAFLNLAHQGSLQSLTRALALAQDPDIRNLVTGPLVTGNILSNAGYVSLYKTRYPGMISSFERAISRMPGGQSKTEARAIYDNVGALLGKIIELRDLPRLSRITKDLTTAYPNDRAEPRYRMDPATNIAYKPQLEPIKWVMVQKGFAGRVEQVVNIPATAAHPYNQRTYAALSTSIDKMVKNVEAGSAVND
ncbi:hypothetical protein V8F33_010708 [Rhypophila sp. PSN 637]